MRFHVIALPHTQTTDAYATCAFTQKVVRFCNMMSDRGHHVFLYAGDDNEARCDEHIPCITVNEQKQAFAELGIDHYVNFPFDPNGSLWSLFASRAVPALWERMRERDFICIIGGRAQEVYAQQFPKNIAVEYGIGYSGTFAKFRVFESYAWMHTIYGAESHGRPDLKDGNYFDAVIPNQYDERHTVGNGEGDERGKYALFVGRMIHRKGYTVAQQACEAAGVRLILAGPGADPGGYGEFIGEVNAPTRIKLMQQASCLLAPTSYIEPFGTVTIEAMACGTPVICTDWGAFTETVGPLDGFRCRTLREYVDAVTAACKGSVYNFNRGGIHVRARNRFSMKVVGDQYETYFRRLLNLFDPLGWAKL